MRLRFDDWPQRLAAFVRERRSLPYAYGSNDCFSYVTDWVRAATGVELLQGVTRPTSSFAAARFLLSEGYRDVDGLATAVLGCMHERAAFAARGDVVSFADAESPSGERHLAVVAGSSAVTPGRDRLLWVPRPLWLTGWQID